MMIDYERAERNRLADEVERRAIGIEGMMKTQRKVKITCVSKIYRALEARLPQCRFTPCEGGAVITMKR